MVYSVSIQSGPQAPADPGARRDAPKLVFQGFPGAQIKERHLLTSTNLLLQVFQDHDPDNLLLRQAQDEMLADQLEFGRLLQWLQALLHLTSGTLMICSLPAPFRGAWRW